MFNSCTKFVASSGSRFRDIWGGCEILIAFSALTLLVGQQEGHPACKKLEYWSAGVVICLERGADLHMAQLIPLMLTVSCSSKIQIGFSFLVPAHLGSPGQRAVKRVCVKRVCVWNSKMRPRKMPYTYTWHVHAVWYHLLEWFAFYPDW